MKNLDGEHKSPFRFISKAIKSVASISVIAVFVVGLGFFVKTASQVNFAKVNSVLAPLYAFFGVSDSEVGEVAGEFISRVSDTHLLPEDNNKTVLTKIAIVADIHSEIANLESALSKIGASNVDYILCMGDLTDFGEVAAITQVKAVLDTASIPYNCLPGDRDLYETVGPQNYENVFSGAATSRYFVKDISGVTFLFFDNSANFTPVSAEWVAWLVSELPAADFVVMPQPLYQNVVSVLNPVMGIVNGEEIIDVKNQANYLLQEIRSSPVKAIISADHHHSSQTLDAVDNSLNHIVVGALASSEKRNLQTPRYTIFTIYTDGTYEFEDIVL